MTRGLRPERPLRVLYFAVRETSYPRNERIRRYLADKLGAEIVIIPARTGSRLRRYGGALYDSLRPVGGADVVILAEFSLMFAPFSWLAARIRRAAHIVDFFVGLHETEVGDSGHTPARSLRARAVRAIDRAAVNLADACFTDTEVRAGLFFEDYSRKAPFFALPVGAPAWARPHNLAGIPRSAHFSLLYYGSYLPLHGIVEFVQTLSRLSAKTPMMLTLIGNGPEYLATRMAAQELPSHIQVDFHDSMPADKLTEFILRSDVVLGAFGSSEKASTVIPNKIWQGLSLGKVVLTKRTIALQELASIVSGQLVELDFLDADPLACALDKARSLVDSRGDAAPEADAPAQVLEQQVNLRYATAFAQEPLVTIFEPSDGRPRN